KDEKPPSVRCNSCLYPNSARWALSEDCPCMRELLSRRRLVEGAILSDTTSVVNSVVAFGTIAPKILAGKRPPRLLLLEVAPRTPGAPRPPPHHPRVPFARTGNGAEARPSASSEDSPCPPSRPSRSTICARSSSAVTAAPACADAGVWSRR